MATPSFSTDTCPAGNDAFTRLSWLRAENASLEAQERRFHSLTEERGMLMMRRPVSTEEAYRLLGLLLGVLPAAVIIFRILDSMFHRETGFLLFFTGAMTLLCGVVGRWIGGLIGKSLLAERPRSLLGLLLLAPFAGAVWGIVTGGLGGMLFFLVGGYFGALCALPVGALAFLVFAPLHRQLARGGMIESGHLWPLAFGVTMVIVGLCASPYLFPYD